MDIKTMSDEALVASLAEKRDAAKALFAVEAPTIEQVDEAEALVASIKDIETEQASRTAEIEEAAQRFSAARASFAAEDEEVEAAAEDDEDPEKEEEEEVEASVEAAAETEADESEESEVAEEADAEAVVTASSRGSRVVPAAKITTARKVAARSKRPAVNESPAVTITAASDVPQFATGQQLGGMEQVTKALMNRVKGFSPFSASAAKAVNSQSGGQPVLNKFGVASFGLNIADELQATNGNDYSAVKAAFKGRGQTPEAMTAGGWCAPSETVYSYVADYVVDGLVQIPEVGAPRGGLNLTTGPARSTQGTALDNFGFTQTEAEAIARDEKTCEVIVCPDFTDHRLDAIGYCYKIPLLTQKAYPELTTDALRLANVLYAHKVNKRVIGDMESLAGVVPTDTLGATFTDTLESVAVLATRRRRKWNIGENAVMEVVLPTIAREIFRADMSRRSGLALSDTATDAKIAAEFAARNLAVQYVADWQEEDSDNLAAKLPNSIDILVYPAGTFIKAVEDVINLSAVYDAAALSINEYTGVFFEQGILVAKAAYGADKLTIPVCTSGYTGAQALACSF